MGINLSSVWNAKADRYARQQGAFILNGEVVLIGEAREVWTFVLALQGRMFRVLYRCQDGTVRDILGRGGVHNSAQDGRVQGIGHAMTSERLLTLSFWTSTYGTKVNVGAGKGYRTLRAEGILALRCEGHDIVTAAGQAAL